MLALVVGGSSRYRSSLTTVSKTLQCCWASQRREIQVANSLQAGNRKMKELQENAVETMECGASLAELEYGGAMDVPKKVESSSGSTSLASKGGAAGGPQSIDSLRSMMASDVLKDGASLTTFSSPFEVPLGVSNPSGKRYLDLPLVYCDQTASNRPVKSIEKYMEDVCLPFYGNTHTNTSITGSQSTAFVAEARQIVAEETNAKITGKASLDVVLFAGNGATSAVELLIDCLGLKHASTTANANANANRPVVFVGPYEHHSNLIPWRESGCEVVMVPECQKSRSVDIGALERLLQTKKYENRLKMGTFTAASNVTGKVCDVDRIAATLHRFGALAFFDYATGAPYMSMDMNPQPSSQYPSSSLVAKDAIFLSPHKMLGGVGTPGVLIIKKHLVDQMNAPSRSGGGTVWYVTNTHHRFLSNRIERYEGGTPNVVGILRVGLAFLHKRKAQEEFASLAEQTGDSPESKAPRSIEDYDCLTHERVANYLGEHAPNLILLGGGEEGRNLPIFSFLIRFGSRFLHFNYVSALLNDVFGIQSRGGCQCAGPYSQRLMGLTDMSKDGEVPNIRNEDIESALLHFKEKAELLRPGYTRISLPFKGLRAEEVDYVLKALVWVSEHGWSLMCQYRCNHRTGEWRHQSRQGKPLGKEERRWLSHYNFAAPTTRSASALDSENENLNDILNETLSNADEILRAAKIDHRNIAQTLKMADAETVLGEDDAKLEELRWYVYPKECAVALSKGRPESPNRDLGSLLGALRPSTGVSVSGEQPACVSPSEFNPASTRGPLAETEGDDAEEEKVSLAMMVGTQLLVFRDGEHTGEASLEEINAGVDDGELSEACEIFDSRQGEWVSSKTFLQTAPDEIVEPAPRRDDMLDKKNAKKKASRDSSTWGQGRVLAANVAPVVEWTASAAVADGSEAMQLEDTSGVPQNPKPSAVVADGSEAMQLEDTLGVPQNPKATSLAKRKRTIHVQPPKKLMRLITRAVVQWDMLKDGDRLLLGLSGGKDSLSLLHCLMELQRKLPIKFEIEVCTIDPMTPSFDPSPLVPYVESLGLKHHYIRDDIVARANSSGKDGKTVSSLCSYCARMKRGNLYSCARSNNCNKLVLGQHLDDCAESFMMSLMHNGFLRTMKANYKIDAGDLGVIRPMVYCRESLMTEFAKSANLPVINENCPACFEEPKERARIKKLLNREETMFPNFYDNIRRSLIPLMHDDSSAILKSYTEEVVSKSVKKPRKAQVDSGQAAASSTMSESRDIEKPELKSLRAASNEDLVMELARRKADQYRLSGVVKLADGDDPTGQVCTLNGGDGSIPCRELME